MTPLRLAVAASIVLLSCWPSLAIARADTPEQASGMGSYHPHHLSGNAPECKGDILVDMSGTKMLVPSGFRFVREDGEEIQRDLRSQLYDCSIASLDHIQEIKSGDLRLLAPPAGFTGLTTYEQKKQAIQDAQEKKTLITLPSGLQKIIRPGSEVYILPQAQAPTGDRNPVVFDCTGQQRHPYETDMCNTSYYLPNKLKLSYTFKWYHDTRDDLMRTDREKRSYVEALITKARQIQQPGDTK